MNAIDHERIFHAIAGHAGQRHRGLRGAARRDFGLQDRGFDLIIVETSGIGQGNAAIVPL